METQQAEAPFRSPLRSQGSAKPPHPGARPVALPSGSCTHTVGTEVSTAAGTDWSGHRPLGAHPAPWSRLEGRLERRRRSRLSGTRGLRRAAGAPPLGRPRSVTLSALRSRPPASLCRPYYEERRGSTGRLLEWRGLLTFVFKASETHLA